MLNDRHLLMRLANASLRASAIAAILAVATPANATTRNYCISADEVLWDYAPSYPVNLMSGLPFSPDQRVFVEGDGSTLVGHIYHKIIYRQYAGKNQDCDWNTLIDGGMGVGEASDVRAGTDRKHLGILGPVIRAEVGDTIVIRFKNSSSSQTLSMHPHGVLYDKASEGAPYDDGTSGAAKLDDRVPPGGGHTYVWEVPERAGPGPNDPSSTAWPYHSHTDEPADTNTGLVGTIVITRKGSARQDGTPKDVDREFFSLFNIFDENSSLLLGSNITDYAPNAVPDDPGFQESNLMHSINGLVYGNNTGYQMNKGERVRWYIFGMGTEVDIHSPHWHGLTLLYHGERVDVTDVIPAVARTLDLKTDNPGTWMFHCHVNDHVLAGMSTKFTVNDAGGNRGPKTSDQYR